ncbi:MAG: type II toxin-antitoxin system VapC family toxin [Opitutaceae bacterium]
MSAYVDTNVLVRLYLEAAGAQDALALLTSPAARPLRPFPVSTLVRLEFANALQRMVCESREPGRWRTSPESATLAAAEFAVHLATAALFQAVPLALEDIESQFESLAARHTARHGFRTYDILHVASALHFGCDTFWSFDAKARKLAKLEGLKTNG